MLTTTIIAKTRDGLPLSRTEIETLIDGYVRGEIPDYQMAAWAMAVRIHGLPAEAVADLTLAMLASGDVLPRDDAADSGDRVPRVDKHSTGGLGDKVSLILAPLLACCGVRVPMISGRGLGFSGGTLDKLESISGFCVDLDVPRSSDVLRSVGCFIVGANPRLVPADRRLYALRDVTACVESIALITASILSKKLAASLDALVMDVKVGSGAFMKSLDQAQALARSLVQTGARAGLPVRALITDMDQPLGWAVGNANEVRESIEVLRGGGPADVRELTIALGAELLEMVQWVEGRADARRTLAAALDNGAAYEVFARMVTAQGGDLDVLLPVAEQVPILAPRGGSIAAIDCEQIGQSVVEMGGGRKQLSDAIDHAVGIDLQVKVGDVVTRGQPLGLVATRDPSQWSGERFQTSFKIVDEAVPCRPLIHDRLVAQGESTGE